MTQARGYLGNRVDRGTSHLSLLAVVALIALFASRQILAQQPSAPAWKSLPGSPCSLGIEVSHGENLPSSRSFRTDQG